VRGERGGLRVGSGIVTGGVGSQEGGGEEQVVG